MNWKPTGLIMVVVLVLGLAAVPSIAADAEKEDAQAKAKSPSQTAKTIIGNIGRFLSFWSDLNLTDDQRQKILAEIKSHSDEIKPLAKEVLEKREALRWAVLNKPGDEQVITAAANDLGKAIGNAAVLASKVIAQVRPIFTPAQQERISNFRMGSDRVIGELINHFTQ